MDMEKQGHEWMKGAISYIAFLGIWTAVILGFFSIVVRVCGLYMDDSDLNGWNRSGLEIYTDQRTGVQYVGNKHGLCLRVDAEGNPVIDVQRDEQESTDVTE